MVYLIHFSSPYKHAKHYLGFAQDEQSRLEQHRSGNGARLCQVAVQNGITLNIVRTWKGMRKVETKLKNLHNAPRLCPVCNPGQTRASYYKPKKTQNEYPNNANS